MRFAGESSAFALGAVGEDGASLRVGVASYRVEDTDMPTTQHSAAAERHLQAAHAHEAAAASHNQNDHMAAHEQSKMAMEHTREAHKLSEELSKESEAR